MTISNSFYERAKALGHDIEELKKGNEVSSKLTFKCFSDLADLCSKISTPEERERRQALIEERAAGREKTFEERVEAHLHGTNALSGDKDLTSVEEGFPTDIIAVSATTKTLKSGQNLVGPNAAPTIWNTDNLVFPAGAYVDVQSTIFTIKATTIRIDS